jgi:hypothetical protein
LIGGSRAVHLPIARDHLATHRATFGQLPCGKGGED